MVRTVAVADGSTRRAVEMGEVRGKPGGVGFLEDVTATVSRTWHGMERRERHII